LTGILQHWEEHDRLKGATVIEPGRIPSGGGYRHTDGLRGVVHQPQAHNCNMLTTEVDDAEDLSVNCHGVEDGNIIGMTLDNID
jgi:hypothetical protein